jgi:methylmalonyl-CoA mutase cobalamin-binding domain/chain
MTGPIDEQRRAARDDREATDDALIDLIADLDEDGALERVRQRLASGESPARIMEDCQKGLAVVGSRYEQGDYFISGLVMAGEIFRETMGLVEPLVKVEHADKPVGTVLLCTVQGDIHDLGKDVMSMLLRSHGYAVRDLGVDVAPDEVAQAVADEAPDVVALSGLLLASFASMRTTVAAVREVGARMGVRIPIIVGGGLMDERTAEWVGADRWSTNAGAGVRIIDELVAQGRTGG